MNAPDAKPYLTLEQRLQRCYLTVEGRTALDQFQMNVGNVNAIKDIQRLKLETGVGHYLQYGPQHAVLLERVVNMLEICGHFKP